MCSSFGIALRGWETDLRELVSLSLTCRTFVKNYLTYSTAIVTTKLLYVLSAEFL